MIEQIVAQINTQIQSQLPWIDRLGGICVPLTGKDRDREVTVPVNANDQSDSCWQSGEYQHFLPDSNKISVAFWERQGTESAEINEQIPKRRGLNRTQALRFLLWANLDRLNGVLKGEEAKLAKEVEYVLLSFNSFLIGTTRVQGSFLERSTDAADIFSSYSFAEEALWFSYPYVAFGFTMSFTWLELVDCPPSSFISVKANPC